MARGRNHTPLRTSAQDIDAVRRTPRTPQTESPAYRLAITDEDFLYSPDMRGVRLQLEFMKPEIRLKELGINSTVVLFGGARIPAPGTEPVAAMTEAARKNLKASSRYYDEARRFAQYASLTARNLDYKEYVVVTGGGPGVMEAGNRGATEVGAPSIGLNVVLPHEQAPNLYITPELCFNFHYFAVRKIHFLMRAKAVAVFPGGYGTLDEFFEALTLVQTQRMDRIPMLLFGKSFWDRVLNLKVLEEEGTISPGDSDLLTVVDTAEEGWNVVRDFYNLPAVRIEE
ncbi:MAG: LOG family protein [Alphaproteobacteria bacterium]|nr:LOG family protein [Alphaproteobacteria bacterium]